jgi:ferredoxin
VLIAVHVLFALHVVHWRLAGETLSPVEPSEGMQLATRSVLNAGAVFFALALLSTVVLGRWFCGWGCHLVALQDGARALLLRAGITPRPLRSRALLVVPVLAFFYMFGWPFVERALAGTPAGARVALTTTRFWETFPGPVVALVTFVVCGGLAVLFLGSKGFCTYACPYGAAFGLLDRLAPWRIKVSDACNSCGQCTAVCSSNVLVHAEVRDYGVVVDPGCMKCLDCVSACPTGALSFGLARPAVLTKPRKTPQARPAAFGWGTELGFAAAFAAFFLAWRGLLHLVPFLLALGLAGCLTFVGWQALRALSGDPAKLLVWPLRDEKKRLTRAGRLLLAGAGLSLAATLWAAGIQLLDRRARTAHAVSATIAPSWEAAIATPPALSPAARAEVEAAADRERLLRRLGLGLDPEVELRLAWFALLLGDDAAVEASVKAGLATIEDATPLRLDWARFLAARGRPPGRPRRVAPPPRGPPGRPRARARRRPGRARRRRPRRRRGPPRARPRGPSRPGHPRGPGLPVREARRRGPGRGAPPRGPRGGRAVRRGAARAAVAWRRRSWWSWLWGSLASRFMLSSATDRSRHVEGVPTRGLLRAVARRRVRHHRARCAPPRCGPRSRRAPEAPLGARGWRRGRTPVGRARRDRRTRGQLRR